MEHKCFFFFLKVTVAEIYTLSKNNLNLRIKTGPVTVGADATLYSHVWFLGQIYVTVASAPAVTDSVLLHRFRLFLTRCT